MEEYTEEPLVTRPIRRALKLKKLRWRLKGSILHTKGRLERKAAKKKGSTVLRS